MLSVQPLLAWTLLLLLPCPLCLGKAIHSFAGPYIGFIRKLDVCPSLGLIIFNAKVSHFNPLRPFDKQSFFGNGSLKTDLDDSLWVHVNISIWANNQWKANAFIFNLPGGACSSMRDQVPSFFRYVTRTIPHVRDRRVPCKIPRGNYINSNDTVDIHFPSVPVFPYGRYRVTTNLLSRDRSKLVCCVQMDYDAIPRPGV